MQAAAAVGIDPVIAGRRAERRGDVNSVRVVRVDCVARQTDVRGIADRNADRIGIAVNRIGTDQNAARWASS